MKAERLQALADAYGADLRRWPADQRAFAESLLAVDPSLRDALDQAAALDALEAQPGGSWILGLTAAGLMAFGAFAFVEARWRRIRRCC